MTTKEKVFDYLKKNCNSYISGQEMADKLFLTRSAVWKAIRSLKNDGHEIVGISNKGYCLRLSGVALSEKLIEEGLSYAKDRLRIIYKNETESTNEDARLLYLSNEDRECLVVSDYQTKGRGRRGRSFISPKGSGIYMSFLLYPRMKIEEAYYLTCMAAVAVARAVCIVTGTQIDIKWVNDLYLKDRKLGGILTEAFTSMEDGGLSYVVLGIGINVFAPEEGFSPPIRDLATALYEGGETEDNIRNRLCAKIVDEFFMLYDANDRSFIKEYKERSNLYGSYVKINSFSDSSKKAAEYAKVIEIDDECHLVVEFDNGTRKILSSGEVSVKKY